MLSEQNSEIQQSQEDISNIDAFDGNLESNLSGADETTAEDILGAELSNQEEELLGEETEGESKMELTEEHAGDDRENLETQPATEEQDDAILDPANELSNANLNSEGNESQAAMATETEEDEQGGQAEEPASDPLQGEYTQEENAAESFTENVLATEEQGEASEESTYRTIEGQSTHEDNVAQSHADYTQLGEQEEEATEEPSSQLIGGENSQEGITAQSSADNVQSAVEQEEQSVGQENRQEETAQSPANDMPTATALEEAKEGSSSQFTGLEYSQEVNAVQSSIDLGFAEGLEEATEESSSQLFNFEYSQAETATSFLTADEGKADDQQEVSMASTSQLLEEGSSQDRDGNNIQAETRANEEEEAAESTSEVQQGMPSNQTSETVVVTTVEDPSENPSSYMLDYAQAQQQSAEVNPHLEVLEESRRVLSVIEGLIREELSISGDQELDMQKPSIVGKVSKPLLDAWKATTSVIQDTNQILAKHQRELIELQESAAQRDNPLFWRYQPYMSPAYDPVNFSQPIMPSPRFFVSSPQGHRHPPQGYLYQRMQHKAEQRAAYNSQAVRAMFAQKREEHALKARSPPSKAWLENIAVRSSQEAARRKQPQASAASDKNFISHIRTERFQLVNQHTKALERYQTSTRSLVSGQAAASHITTFLTLPPDEGIAALRASSPDVFCKTSSTCSSPTSLPPLVHIHSNS